MPLLLSLGALSSCNPPAKDGEKKVALSFSRHFGVDSLAEGYDDPNVLFHGFDEKVERNGVSKMEKRYIASEMEVQAMLDKKANFIIASVPDFTCLCWKNFVKETFSTVIVDLKADVYVIDAKTAIKNEAWGIQTSGNDPVLAIMSNGKAAYQTALKEKSDLVTNKKKLSLWIENRATFSQMYWVNEESEVRQFRIQTGNPQETGDRAECAHQVLPEDTCHVACLYLPWQPEDRACDERIACPDHHLRQDVQALQRAVLRHQSLPAIRKRQDCKGNQYGTGNVRHAAILCGN